MSGVVLEPTERKCAASYCRERVLATRKYCAKHEKMNGGQIIAEGKALEPMRTIVLSFDQVEALVEYALRDLMEKRK